MSSDVETIAAAAPQNDIETISATVSGLDIFDFSFQANKSSGILGRKSSFLVTATVRKTKLSYAGTVKSINGFRADKIVEQLKAFIVGQDTTPLIFTVTMGTTNPDRIKLITVTHSGAATGVSDRTMLVKFDKLRSDPIDRMAQTIAELQDVVEDLRTKLSTVLLKSSMMTDSTVEEGSRDLELNLTLDLIPVGEDWAITQSGSGLAFVNKNSGTAATLMPNGNWM